MFQEIHQTLIAEANAIWYVGNHTLQAAYEALCAEPYHLLYLSTFQFAETRTSQIMQFNHAVSAVLDLINSNKYVPKVVVIHVGESDFRVMPQHLIKFFTAQMSNTKRNSNFMQFGRQIVPKRLQFL